MRLARSAIWIGASLRNTAPRSSTTTAIGFFPTLSAPADVLGKSTATPLVSSGAATMKMMSSTSITSMNGVMLMSAIAP